MDPVIDTTVRAALVLLLGAAAFHKLRDPAAFRRVLGEYRLLPRAVVAGVARVVPAVELACVLAMAVPAARRAGLVATATLLAVYAIAMGINLARGRRDLDCGCFGPGHRRQLSGWLVARNVAVAAVALVPLAPARSRPLVWVDVATVLCATAAVAATWIAADVLLAQAPALARLRVRR